MAEARVVEPDLEFIRSVKKAGGADVKKCYQCATCSSVCSLSTTEKPFPRKEMLLAGWGQADTLSKDPDIWLCYQCNDCSTYCPREAKPGDVLAAVRSFVYERFAFPSFMGHALAAPRALPLLFLAPMLVIAAVIFASKTLQLQLSLREPGLADAVVFDKVFNIHVVEPLFIAGNILVFACAFAGLWRFWNQLESRSSGAGIGFVAGVVAAVKDIVFHTPFFSCDANKTRSWAHLMVFLGFFGAAATAGLGAVELKLFHHPPPIPLGHPIKWLGNLSGVLGILGTGILLVRRLADKESVGANGYQDWLFLIMLFLAFVTGMTTQLTRLSGLDAAYAAYYVHLVVVFFVLWYAPYSKFAHMFYRALAVVHAHAAGRRRKTAS
ncbi:MAG: quinone-interacting membrane-bound oxidoreductase complex subunit QmoC [Elusimicrobia bacterium]|nr:quinone-interacting membrane-bound oxidoreductase complex subunit QmoC [Elusimicrobiota bacterium]